jgi:hypothetical protein
MEDKDKTHWGDTEFGENVGMAILTFATLLGLALVIVAVGWGTYKSKESEKPTQIEKLTQDKL